MLAAGGITAGLTRSGIDRAAAATPPPKLNVTINVVGDAGHNMLPFEYYAKEIKDQTGISIKATGVPFTEVYSKLKTEFVGQTGAYDLVVFFPSAIGEFAGLGYLRPLDDLAQKYDPRLSDVTPWFRELYIKYQGKLYALPYDGDVLNYWYRTDLFANADERANFKKKFGRDLTVPETWDEAFQIAQFFTRKKGEKLAGTVLNENFYGYAFLGLRGFSYAWFLSHFTPRGGTYFDKDMNPQINTATAVQALEEMKKSMAFSPPDVLSYGYDELKNAYLGGHIATLVQWEDMLKKSRDTSASKIVGKVGMYHVPGVRVNGKVVFRSPMPVARVLAVPAASKNPEAAYWVAWYLSVVKSPEFTADPRNGLDPYSFVQFNNPAQYAKMNGAGQPLTVDEARTYLKQLKADYERGFPDLTIPGASEYLDKLDLAVTQALSGELSPKAALDRAAADWRDITQRLGVDKQKKELQIMLEGWRRAGLTQ